MSTHNRAVFLSYASQDAEAARRICETLRTEGIEVWFDADGGLEHGDEWDAKIRRQIKECLLFIPIISANTQARHEGYFRIEWELAAQRAMGIASGVPFILPVVIDETRELDALVPDRFRAVQWTRLRGGEMTPEVKVRFLKLWSHRIGALKGARDSGDRSPPTPSAEFSIPAAAGSGDPVLYPSRPSRAHAAKIGTFVAVAVIGVAAIAWWQRPRGAAPAAGTGPAAATPRVAPGSEVDLLVARAYGLFEKRINYTRTDLAAADTLTRKATELAPESGVAWAARAYVQAAYVWRFWDRSEKRLQDTEAFATRALAFDPTQTKAMLALAELHNAQRAFAQAEVLARRAIALRPDDSHLHRVLIGAVVGQGRADEADALRQEMVQKFPRDPLTHYGFGNRQIRLGDFPGALQSFDTALALEPFTSARLNKARLLAAWKGDLAAAREVIDQIPPEDRTEIRAVGVAMWLGLLEHRLDRVQAAAALTTQAYLDDEMLVASGPKAMFVGLAFRVAGKETLAQLQWGAAESAARSRLREQPGDLRASAHLATALAWLARTDEAGREIATFEATAREQPGDDSRAILLARFYASLGNASKATSYLRSAGNSLETTAPLLSLDPWWDKLRGQPEFEAFVVEAKTKITANPSSPAGPPAVPDLSAAGLAKADPKSVVVLPFANLSGDKEQEYFSDGLTEEILNALARERDLRVVPRASAFSFKGKNLSLPEIARVLNVAQVIDGSVRRAGNVVRIDCTLTRAGEFTESLRRFEKEMKNAGDIFALQDEVAREVVEKLTRRAALPPALVPTTSLAAYDLFLKARAVQNSVADDVENEKQIGFLEEAVRLDPNFAAAWAALASSYTNTYLLGQRAPGRLARARAAVDTARRLAPDAPATIHAQGDYFYRGMRDYVRAAEHYEMLARLQPSDPAGHHELGLMLRRQGKWAESIARLRKAVELDPRNARVLEDLAATYRWARAYGEAEVMQRRVVEQSVGDLQLSSMFDLVTLSFRATGTNRVVDEWLAQLTAEQRNSPLGIALRKEWAQMRGDFAEAIRLDRIQPYGNEGRSSPHAQALMAATVYAAVGDLAGAGGRLGDFPKQLRSRLEREPDNVQLWGYLGCMEALLGHRESALNCANQAMVLMPASVDAVFHAVARYRLAFVHAWTGNKDESLEELRKLVGNCSSGFNAHQAKRDAWFAPLRGDPRFEALLNDPKNNAPLF